MQRARSWRLLDRSLPLSEPVGVGVVNVTADSMFAGARSVTAEGAIRDGRRLLDAGFAMLDVGAVAARAGDPVPAADEVGRLVPALEGLAAAGAALSADTFSPQVARAAVAAGAEAINDIGGGSDEMLATVAELGCGYVLMQIAGPPRVDRPAPVLADPVGHLLEWFGARLERARELGIDPERIAIDPGLDFDLDTDHALVLLDRIDELHALGAPIYLSLSRKDFLGALLAGSWEQRLGSGDRGNATVAAAALAAAAGVQLHRLHDPAALDAIRVAGALRG